MFKSRSAVVGLVSGLASALLAYGVALGVRIKTGQDYPQLGFLPIALAAVSSNLLGSWAFDFLVRWVPAPRTAFTFLVLAVAFLYTMAVGAHPPADGFLEAVTPIHLMVAVTAIFLIPSLSSGAPRKPNSNRTKP